MGLEGLQFVQVDMPLVAGVDTRDDPRALPMGKLTTLENYEINRVGRIESRRGIALGAAAASGPTAGGRPDSTLVSVAARGNEMLAVGDRRVSAWSPTQSAWVDRGRAPGPAVTTNVVQADEQTSLTLSDAASTGAFTVVASVEASSDASNARRLRVTVIDENSGGEVANWIYAWGTGDNDVPFEQYTVVVAGPTYAWVFVPQMVGSSGHTTLKINYLVVNTTTLNVKPTMYNASFTGQVEGRVVFDACYWPSQDAALAIVPTTISAGNDVAVVKVTNGASLSTVSYTKLSGASAPLKAVGVCVDALNAGYHFVVANDGSTTTQRRLLNGSSFGALVTLTNPLLAWECHRIGVVSTGISGASGPEFVVVLDEGSVGGAYAVRLCTTSASGTHTVKVAPRYVSLMSRPFTYGGNVYYVAAEARGNSYFVMDANYTPLAATQDPNSTELAGNILPADGGGVQGEVVLWQGALSSYTNVQHLQSVTLTSLLTYRLSLPRKLEAQWLLKDERTGSETYVDPLKQSRTGTALTDLKFLPAVANVATGPTTHLAGGSPTNVDLARAYEIGFAWEPWNFTASIGTGSSTAKLEPGTYSYAVCYAHTRADGTVERSAPTLLKDPVVTSELLATTTGDFQQPDVYDATKTASHDGFTMPAHGLSTGVNVGVSTIAWMAAGQVVFSTTGGFLKIDHPYPTPPRTPLVNPYVAGPGSVWASELNPAAGTAVGSGVLYANLSAFKVDSTASFYAGQQITVAAAYNQNGDDYIVHQVWDANWVVVRSLGGGNTAPGGVILSGKFIFRTAEVVNLSWVPLTLTNKTSVSNPSPGTFAAELYRTSDLGEVYYFIATVPINPSVTMMTYTDNVPQAVAQSNRQLYTTGGVLSHFMPPSATHVTEHGGRIMLSGCEDATRIMASLYLTPFEAAAFNPSLYIQCPEPIVATASLDSALVAFARSAIYVVFGDGPDDLGQNDNWSLPNKLPSDVGCIEPRSVVVIPDGVLFQSARGIFLLSRKRELQFVGADAQAILAQYPMITSAVLLQDKKHVRFTLVPEPGSDQGVVLTYFYEYGQWGTATHKTTLGDPLCSAGAAVVNGAYWSGAYSREVYTEVKAYQDADGSVIVTSFGGQASFDGQWGHVRLQKLRLLGRSLALGTVSLFLTTDEDLTRQETVTWANVDALTLEHVLAYQIGSRFQYTVTVTPTTPVGDIQLNSVQFFSGRRRGMARVPATSRS